MPYRKEKFINNEVYHIILRGIDGNLIFKDINDYYRGIFSIYEFNNSKAVDIRRRREIRKRIKKNEDPFFITEDEREKIVEVLAFCLMPNHIHLLIKQIKENGITNFARKLGTGYGSYFNKKFDRKGYVFQGRFKDVRIKNDNQLMIVLNYIHANPISIIEPNWKESGIKNLKKVNDFLENYKWSSYQDYIGKKNFPSVTEREFILQTIGGEIECKKAIRNLVKYRKEIKKFSEILLD